MTEPEAGAGADGLIGKDNDSSLSSAMDENNILSDEEQEKSPSEHSSSSELSANIAEAVFHKGGGNMKLINPVIYISSGNIGNIKHEGSRKPINAMKMAENGGTINEHDTRNTLAVQTPSGDTSAEAKGIKENVATLGGVEKKNATFGSSTQKTRTKLAEVKKNLQEYGVRVQRFTRDFQFGKEWEGRFSDQKVTIMQFNEDDAEKYENAVDVLTDLEHENIVHFIKEIPEICAILTEFCEYGTLKEYVAGAVKLSELLRMAAQIASGMDFLHQNKYVHCGLCAANVAVTANLLCKVSGFGTARHVGMRGRSSVGKNDILTKWAAQEVFEKGVVSFKSDVWSFGVVLWEFVTRGDEPYPGLKDIQIGASLRRGHRMLKPKQCPSGLYFDIMMPCWDKDPDARPTFECLEKSLLSYNVEADQKEESVTVRAVFDCLAVREGKLSYKKGDIIVDCTVYSESGGWSRGTLDGKTGKFSSNYVVQIKTHEA